MVALAVYSSKHAVHPQTFLFLLCAYSHYGLEVSEFEILYNKIQYAETRPNRQVLQNTSISGVYFFVKNILPAIIARGIHKISLAAFYPE